MYLRLISKALTEEDKIALELWGALVAQMWERRMWKMRLPYDRGRLAQVVIYYYIIRHSSDAKIPLCRKHKPYHCT